MFIALLFVAPMLFYLEVVVDNPEAVQALIAIVQSALTQLGIPAVFVLAWWWERRAHQETIRCYTRDLRKCAGMMLPEDVLVQSSVSGGD